MASNLNNKYRSWSEAARSGLYTHAPDTAAPQGVGTASFPRGGLQGQQDDLLKMKMEFVNASNGTGMSPLGQITATTGDLRKLQQYRDLEDYANFDAWVGANFHKADMPTRRWLMDIWPEFFEARERLMVERAQFALRVRLVQLRGPANEEDLLLIHALQTGRVALDRDWDRIGPAWEPGSDKTTEGKEHERFAQGLFGFPRLYSEKERRVNAENVTNPFKPKNDGLGGFQPDDKKFVGNAVPEKNRYPAFVRDVLQKYMYPSRDVGGVAGAAGAAGNPAGGNLPSGFPQ